MLSDNWISGIGDGQFKVKYNDYQSNYFASAGIDNKESLLADNSFYAFNEPLQIIVEHGIIGFLLYAISVVCLFKQLKNIPISDKTPIVISAIASLVCIATASFFFYPSHVTTIVIHGLLSLAIINSSATGQNKIIISNLKSKIVKGAFTLFSVLLIIHYASLVHYRIEGKSALDCANTGFKNKAIETYAVLNRSYIKDGKTLYLYANELYNANKLVSANEIIQKAKCYYSTNDVYMLSASIAHGLQLNDEAEKDFKKAVYMVPGRIRSRYNLLRYYIAVKDTCKAIFWAESILKMTVKIPSEKSSNLKKKTQQILQSIKQKDYP